MKTTQKILISGIVLLVLSVSVYLLINRDTKISTQEEFIRRSAEGEVSLEDLDLDACFEYASLDLEDDWVVGYEQDTGREVVIEHVKDGESIEDWTELVTLYVLRVDSIDLDTYIDVLVSGKGGPEGFVGGNVTVMDEKDFDGFPARVIRIDGIGTPEDKESRVELAIAGNTGLYSTQRAKKSEKLDDQTAQEWQSFLTSRTEICNSCEEKEGCSLE